MPTNTLHAAVLDRNGTPTLEINGKPTAPLIFFFNTEVEKGFKFLEPQVRLAASAGVHLYSFCLPWPWMTPGEEPDYSSGERFMDLFLNADPEALFIPRMRCEGPDAWIEAHPEARIVYQDGTKPMMTSMGSDLWAETLHEGLARAIRHYEASPYGARILAYHPAGQNSNEWFHYEYWLRGADYSEANTSKFRDWLRAKYGSDAALAEAWGNGAPTIGAATIPEPPVAGDGPFVVFASPTDRRRVDFQDYTNAIVADRIIDIAAVIKRETARRKAVVIFYGYGFEMHGAESGHFSMEPVLASPDIDMLSSPLSYLDRQAGGCGGFMTCVDSVSAHGKLWIVENDYRTHSIVIEELPEWMTEEGLGPRAADLDYTLGVIARDFGAMLAHRCGTWWMDLISAGAYKDPAVWAMIGNKLAPLVSQLNKEPAPFAPDVAVIVDEASLCAMNYPPGEGMACYSPAYDYLCRKARGEFARAGVDCGWYYLGDFLAGLVPACKAYWFPNLFRVNAETADAIVRRLDETRATAIWQYAPGWLGAVNDRIAHRLTGFEQRQSAGAMGTVGYGELAGFAWGQGFDLDPRMEADTSDGEILGRYRAGNGVSAARKPHGDHTSVFIGDIRPGWQAIARILERAGVHRWTRDGGIAYTDGRTLFVHHGQPGVHTIHLPDHFQACEVGTAHAPHRGAIEATFNAGQTKVFTLTAR